MQQGACRAQSVMLLQLWKGARAISAYTNVRSGLAASAATTVSRMYCTPASCARKPSLSRMLFSLVRQHDSTVLPCGVKSVQAARLYVLIGAIVVLVNGLQPADIVVCVRHYVHV